jgi:aspartate kinase
MDAISHDEMLELASLGAKVLQSRSVEFAKKYSVPLVVRSSFSDAPGTWIIKETEQMEDVVVRGVSLDKNQAKITFLHVPDTPGVAATMFRTLADRAINVDMIVQNVSEQGKTDVSFTVPADDLDRALGVSREIADMVGAAAVVPDRDIAKLSAVGVGMRTHTGIAAKMFGILSEARINIAMISTSEIKISCVIPKEHADKALRLVHNGFGLGGAENAEPEK